jgi:hypothetical protein
LLPHVQHAPGEDTDSPETAMAMTAWEREMLMSVSLWAVLLTLVLPLLVVGEALAQSQADAPHATNLYPGRYVAVCKPAPIIGCLCSSDSQGEMSVFPELTGAADHRPKDVRDTEYLQMVTWLRRTCALLTRPTNIE